MALYLVSFSGRLTQHALAARTELQKWGATKLWDDVWIVEMEPGPEVCLPGFVQTEAALSIPLDDSTAFFSIGRAAGFAAQLAFTEQVAPRLRPPDTPGAEFALVHYCNNGEAVFEKVVAQYLWARQHSIWATDLCRLMARYGSDKGIGWHTYTPFYQSLLLDRREAVTTLFELGLGTNHEDMPSNMGAHGKPGASLRAWRDYFSNARVYGADVDKRVLFNEERIDTFFVDQCVPDTFDALWANMSDVKFDVFLDDGLHTFDAARTTFTQSIDKVKDGGYYIIEDVKRDELDKYLQMVKESGLQGMSIEIYHAANVYDNCLIVAARK